VPGANSKQPFWSLLHVKVTVSPSAKTFINIKRIIIFLHYVNTNQGIRIFVTRPVCMKTIPVKSRPRAFQYGNDLYESSENWRYYLKGKEIFCGFQFS
jgi:hypothetical protein